MQAAAFAVRENASEGIEFQRSLLSAIERADRIIVREHSDPMDFDNGGETLPVAPEKTYVRKELSGFQKLRFASLVRAMSPARSHRTLFPHASLSITTPSGSSTRRGARAQ